MFSYVGNSSLIFVWFEIDLYIEKVGYTLETIGKILLTHT